MLRAMRVVNGAIAEVVEREALPVREARTKLVKRLVPVLREERDVREERVVGEDGEEIVRQVEEVRQVEAEEEREVEEVEYFDRPATLADLFHPALGFETAPEGVEVGMVRKSKGWVMPPPAPPAPPAPRRCARREYRAALARLGWLDALDEAARALPAAKAETRVAWFDEDLFVEGQVKRGKVLALKGRADAAVFDEVDRARAAP